MGVCMIFSVRRIVQIVPVLVLAFATRAAALTADSADDVCPSNADPCNVTEKIDVVANSTLEFGARAVHVSGSGGFDFGAGSGRIQCGPFEANTRGNAIDATGPGDAGGTDSGSIAIDARRLCSGAADHVCLST